MNTIVCTPRFAPSSSKVSPCADENVAVSRAGVEHVLEAREHPVAAGAPVDGILVAQAPVERVRIAPGVAPERSVLDGGRHTEVTNGPDVVERSAGDASGASKLLAGASVGAGIPRASAAQERA